MQAVIAHGCAPDNSPPSDLKTFQLVFSCRTARKSDVSLQRVTYYRPYRLSGGTWAARNSAKQRFADDNRTAACWSSRSVFGHVQCSRTDVSALRVGPQAGWCNE